MAKNKSKIEVSDLEFVYIQNGKGPISKYTKERYEKFKDNLTASGYRVLKLEEIKAYLESKGLVLQEVVKPKESDKSDANLGQNQDQNLDT